MPVTIAHIHEQLESLKLKVLSSSDPEVVAYERAVIFSTDSYVNPEGENKLLIVVKLSQDGEYLEVVAPSAYAVRECKFKGAVFAAFLHFTYMTKYVQFEYDPEDGEIRLSADFPVCDGTITALQLEPLLHSICATLEQFHPVIVRAMATGRVDMALATRNEPTPQLPEEIAKLIEQIGGVDELRKLAESKRGDSAQ
jgi:hypothetical protein